MSSEIKAYLKEAREAIKDKKFTLAVKICKDILKKDENNYMTYILLGAASQESNKAEAINYLKKALLLSKEPIVALQGLINCVDPIEIPPYCENLLNLTPDKFLGLHEKLVNTAKKNIAFDLCVEVLRKDTEIEENEINNSRIYSAWESIVQIFMSTTNLPETFIELFNRGLECVLKNPNGKERLGRFMIYLRNLYQVKNTNMLLIKACEMSELYPNDSYPLEWICKVYVENYENVQIKDNLTQEIDVFVENLLKINPENIYCLMAKGICAFEQKKYMESKEILERVNVLQKNWNTCLNILVNLYMILGAYSMAEEIFRLLKRNDYLFCKCLVQQEEKTKMPEAIKLCKELLLIGKSDEQKHLLFILAKALIYNEETESADTIINNLKNSGHIQDATFLTALNFKVIGDYTRSLEILEKNPINNNFMYFLELGEINFKLKKYEESLLPLLKATKLEPFNSVCFFWLGKLYLTINDELRAKKCFEKCLNLNILNRNGFMLLSSINRKNSDWKANNLLLQSLLKTPSASKSGWTWKQLGLNYLSQLNYNDAIESYRSGLRFDTRDIEIWEGLADAYFARGSYNSAIKVYQKAAEIDLKSSYPKLQIARINTILMQFNEAIKSFEQLLEVNEKYFPALKGIADAHLGLATNLFNQQLTGRARDHVQQAVNYLTRSVEMKPNYVGVWRQLGNAIEKVAILPVTNSYLIINGSLAGVKDNEITLTSDKLYELAARCYCRAIKMNNNDSLLWYELANNYYLRAIKYNKNSDIKKEYLMLASEASKYTIKLNSISWKNWNLLGVISATNEINNPALAQHCFINALNIDKKSSIAWTNLGLLYLTQSHIKLANKSFSLSQQSDPNFLNAWAGQAIIAESIGEGDEALDLFRHCTQLGFHPESAIGYTHWVCSIIGDPKNLNDPKYKYDIEKMYAIPLALDSMNWFCSHDANNSTTESLCFQGYLNYYQGLWNSSEKSFRLAVEKVQDSGRDKILCNLGYSLLKTNRPLEAIEVFQRVTEATLKATIGLALAHSKAKQYENSYTMYENALQWLAKSDAEKSLILIAMSAMVYEFQGEKDAKTVLFQCLGLSSPPIEGLFSACALGILHKDIQLSELALQELQKYENDKEHCHHVAFLRSQMLLQNNKINEALIYLLKRVQRMPDRPLLRKVLANFLLNNLKTSKKHLIAASRVAQSAIVLNMKNLKQNISLDSSKLFAMASEAMRHVDQNKRKILAQKAVHINPGCKEAWCALNLCV